MTIVIFMYLKNRMRHHCKSNWSRSMKLNITKTKLRKLPNPFCPAVSVKLCAETLTALWGIKGMTRLRYLVHVASLSTAKEDNSVFSFHQTQSLPLAMLVQNRAFWSNYVTV